MVKVLSCGGYRSAYYGMRDGISGEEEWVGGMVGWSVQSRRYEITDAIVGYCVGRMYIGDYQTVRHCKSVLRVSDTILHTFKNQQQQIPQSQNQQ